MGKFTQQLLEFHSIDIIWGVPWLCLSILAMKYFFDAAFEIYFKTSSNERGLLLDYLGKRNTLGVKEILEGSKDILIRSIAPLMPPNHSVSEMDSVSLKSKIKDSLQGYLDTNVPHENFFHFYKEVILLISYGGNLISAIYLLNTFDINNSVFSDVFRICSIGLKSSLLGVGASAAMASGGIYLKKMMERRRGVAEDFCENLIKKLNHIERSLR